MKNTTYITTTGLEIDCDPIGRQNRSRYEAMAKNYAEHLEKIEKIKKEGENNAV